MSLFAAFRATLEEISDSDLLVHVVDASNPNHFAQIESVDKILLELDLNQIPQIIVLNKADLVDKDEIEAIMRRLSLEKTAECIAVSAVKPDTLALLVETIDNKLNAPTEKARIKISSGSL